VETSFLIFVALGSREKERERARVRAREKEKKRERKRKSETVKDLFSSLITTIFSRE